MAKYYVVETKNVNMSNGHERFVSKDEFVARSVMNLIIASEFCDFDKKSHMDHGDGSFIDGWKFWDKTQHFDEGDWITLRIYDVEE